MTGNNTLEQINKRGDKVIGIFKMTVAPAGKTAKCSYDDELDNTTTSFEMTKQ
jgi:hypothetical protein